jgi:C-5 cytosine-specific DNA methylase
VSKPLAVDLCAGLGGWSSGLLVEGWDVVGFDIERHEYGDHKYPAQLVLQDILTLDGRQFRGKVQLIVASPPCQEFSYMAMPWTRAKQIAAALRGEGHFPDGYTGSRTVPELTALFDACFRIAREAECPIVLENVRGAQPWVGKARWVFGSFALWGDVPALMPIPTKAQKFNPDGSAHGQNPDGRKAGKANADPDLMSNWGREGVKQPGLSGPRDNGKGDRWFQDGAAHHGSKSSARKAASARIAKIPFPLASWIAHSFHPRTAQGAA